jgi:hypothetical protein
MVYQVNAVTMRNKLPEFIKTKITEMPEYRQGTNKVCVTLKDGRKYAARIT